MGALDLTTGINEKGYTPGFFILKDPTENGNKGHKH